MILRRLSKAHCSAGLGHAMLFSGCVLFIFMPLLNLQHASRQATEGRLKILIPEYIALNSGDWISSYSDEQIEYAILVTLFSRGEFSSGSCHPVNTPCPGLTFHCLHFASPSGICGRNKVTVAPVLLMTLCLPEVKGLYQCHVNKESITLGCLLPPRYPEICISTLAESRALLFPILSCLVKPREPLSLPLE